MTRYRDWSTLREIDLAAGTAKGSAFRCFKRQAGTLRQDRDYVVLDANRDAEAIRELRDSGRIYATSINVVLLSPALANTVLQTLQGPPG